MENLTVISGSGERFELYLPEPELIRKAAEKLSCSMELEQGKRRTVIPQILAPFFPSRCRESLALISEPDVFKLISAFRRLAGEEYTSALADLTEPERKTRAQLPSLTFPSFFQTSEKEFGEGGGVRSFDALSFSLPESSFLEGNGNFFFSNPFPVASGTEKPLPETPLFWDCGQTLPRNEYTPGQPSSGAPPFSLTVFQPPEQKEYLPGYVFRREAPEYSFLPDFQRDHLKTFMYGTETEPFSVISAVVPPLLFEEEHWTVPPLHSETLSPAFSVVLPQIQQGLEGLTTYTFPFELSQREITVAVPQLHPETEGLTTYTLPLEVAQREITVAVPQLQPETEGLRTYTLPLEAAQREIAVAVPQLQPETEGLTTYTLPLEVAQREITVAVPQLQPETEGGKTYTVPLQAAQRQFSADMPQELTAGDAAEDPSLALPFFFSAQEKTGLSSFTLTEERFFPVGRGVEEVKPQYPFEFTALSTLSTPPEDLPADAPESSEKKPGTMKKSFFSFLQTLPQRVTALLRRKYLSRKKLSAEEDENSATFPVVVTPAVSPRQELRFSFMPEESYRVSALGAPSIPPERERENQPAFNKRVPAEERTPLCFGETTTEQGRSYGDEVIAAAYCYKWHLEYAASLPPELLERCLRIAGVRHRAPEPEVTFSAEEINDAIRRNEELREKLKKKQE